MAWLGVARRGPGHGGRARLGVARKSTARRGAVRQALARLGGEARPGEAEARKSRLGVARVSAPAGGGEALRPGVARQGLAGRRGEARYIRLGLKGRPSMYDMTRDALAELILA